MRRAARVDANQAAIVEAVRKAGALVSVTSALGRGFVDLVVAFRGRVMLWEVKDGTKPPSQQALTPDEQRFHAQWAGYVEVVRSVDEALALLGLVED